LAYVLSNVALVLKEFLDYLESHFAGTNYVYDEGLSYETALKNHRAEMELTGGEEPFLPAFIFKRMTLRHTEHGIAGRASTSVAQAGVVDGQRLKYKWVLGELEIPFLYVNESAVEMEKFEIFYLAERALAQEKYIECEIPDVETYKYSVDYTKALDETTFNIEGNYYKTVAGTVTIRGVFYLFEGEGAVIEQINAAIKSVYGQVLSERTITS